MVMMVTIPTPPTSKEMPPSAPTAAVRISRIFDRVRSMSSWVVRVKSSRPWRALSRLRMAEATSPEAMPSRYETSISSRPLRL